jgi:uncharacterized protein YecE (DUF72 family)
MSIPPIGTVDIPAKIERDRYFRELTYLELSTLFAGPVKPGTLARLAEVAPKSSIGLVAPSPLTHRKPPPSANPWPTDATCGDFRISEPGNAALASLRAAIDVLDARSVVFRSPETFSSSAANRDQLQRFFGVVELGVERVWVPGGLWEVPAAAKVARELGLTLSIDPFVRDPSDPPEIHYDLDVPALYLRIESAGRAGPLNTERLEDLAALVQHYEDLPLTVVFASPDRWRDARNFKKLLEPAERL